VSPDEETPKSFPTSWEERQDFIEELSGSVAEEIERRRVILQNAYPFEVVSNSLIYRPSVTGVYEFCLAASINPTGAASDQYRASAVFEYITRDILVNFFGPGTRAIRTGWPAYESENRGTSPKEFFEALHEECGEFKWSPQEDHPVDPPNTLLKDVGLDVVAWKPWPDNRLAQFFALAQCACGKNDIHSKSGDASFSRLGKWLRPIYHATPIRCLFCAHHLPNQPWLYELSGEAGLVFDRARIALLAESNAAAMQSHEGIDYHAMASIYASAYANV
jgi:hypothetical protein